MNLRAFFALRLPDAVVRWLSDQADTLCQFDQGGEVSWVDTDRYHLTLCFLGDISLDQVARLESCARQHLSHVSSFQVHINSTAYYRVNQRLALVAAIPELSEALQNLHLGMVQVVEAADISYKEIGFKPHITLGRLSGDNQFQPPDKFPAIDMYSLADAVVLMQSRPVEGGSIYTPLFEVPLQTMI
ncbi:RNA 2',3'-cyclic phosphodiesterase [Pontibacter sp. JAM-7]|uniref:RNA 2',3'-cyclic phosphodiesterase n=1 Tax=Pontibacter sp. JAM-7 TaxID=3366581 RepID=UPI003AF7D04E